jgi:hypothetical protein
VFWEHDPHAMPAGFKAVADGAVIQPPIELRYLRADVLGDPIARVGWAILYPKPDRAAEPVKRPP